MWLWTTLNRLQPADERQPLQAGSRWWAPLLDVGRDRELRRLGLVSLVYAMAQQSFLTFLVSLLHLQGGLSLAVAAAILAASQVASTAARVGFGHVADRWMPPPRLLGWMGIAMSLGLVLLAWVGTTGQVMGSALAALVCGTFVMGWNGVFFAELVRPVSGGAVGGVGRQLRPGYVVDGTRPCRRRVDVAQAIRARSHTRLRLAASLVTKMTGRGFAAVCQIRKPTLPNCNPLSRRSSAACASARSYTWSITGVSWWRLTNASSSCISCRLPSVEPITCN